MTIDPRPVSSGGQRGALPPGIEARVARDLGDRFRRLREAAARVRLGAGPGLEPDPEAIHDLRVAARRLAAALGLWRGLLPNRGTRRARRRLRRLRRRLGPVREREVHAIRLAALLPGLSPEARVTAEALLLRLTPRLARGRRRAAARLRDARIGRTVRRLRRRIGRRRRAAADPAALARARIGALRIAASVALRDGLASGREASLHEARLGIKRWRYALECLEPVLDASFRLGPIRDLQEALGDFHDFTTLAAWVRRRAHRLEARGASATAEALGTLAAHIEGEQARALDQVRRSAMRLEPEDVPETAPEPGLTGGPPGHGLAETGRPA